MSSIERVLFSEGSVVSIERGKDSNTKTVLDVVTEILRILKLQVLNHFLQEGPHRFSCFLYSSQH